MVQLKIDVNERLFMQNLKEIQLTIFLYLIFCPLLVAQIGINTHSPNATVDIVGAADDPQKADGIIVPRLSGEQLKTKDGTYGKEQDGTLIYVTVPLQSNNTSAKTINVLEKGYYFFNASKGQEGEWLWLYRGYPQIIYGGEVGSANNGGPLTISSTNGANTTAILLSKNFELKRPCFISFNFSIPITNITLVNLGMPDSDNSKLLATNLFITGGALNNYLVARDGISISNFSSGSYTSSGYQLKGSRSLLLQAGTYKVTLNPLVYAQDGGGIRATYGDNEYTDTVLDIVAFPVP